MNEPALTENNTTTYNIDQLNDLTRADMARVNQVIVDHLASPVVLINQLSRHIIHSGGKRLRPTLVMLCAKACDYQGDQDALLAAVVEFIHTATLLHDDVVDDSDLRRGPETASSIWGNEAAVLVGDYLYSRAFQMMVKAHSMHMMDILANATNTIAQGEVLQLLNINDANTSEERYIEVIYGKTACLFEAATQIGAVLSDSDKQTEQALKSYGKHLGMAFQLIDDALDYTANPDELGKNVGDDLAEGKPTLPLIYAMQQGNDEQQALIRNAIENGGLDHIDAITQIIHDTGALEYTYQQAINEANLAKQSIALLPKSAYTEALTFLADYSVKRSH
jgi:octaprenyl-diphosphate synthase